METVHGIALAPVMEELHIRRRGGRGRGAAALLGADIFHYIAEETNAYPQQQGETQFHVSANEIAAFIRININCYGYYQLTKYSWLLECQCHS